MTIALAFATSFTDRVSFIALVKKLVICQGHVQYDLTLTLRCLQVKQPLRVLRCLT